MLGNPVFLIGDVAGWAAVVALEKKSVLTRFPRCV